MRSILITLTIIAASALLLATAASAECLPTSAAVFAAHPNAAHAAYEGRSHPGQRCWYMDREKTNVRKADGSRVVGATPQGIAVRLPPDRASRPAVAPQPNPSGAVESNAAAQAEASQVNAPVPRPRPESAPPATRPPAASPQEIREAVERYALIHAHTLYVRAAFSVLMPEALAKLREAGR